MLCLKLENDETVLVIERAASERIYRQSEEEGYK